jgi:hypothetical protein
MLEPLLLGLLVAPSLAGVLLTVATIAAFFLRQPLKITLVDRRRHLFTARTARARTSSVALALIAAFSFGASIWLAGPSFLTPLMLALPFAAVFLFYDLSRPGRTVQAEVTAPLALAGVTAAMAVIDGWPLANALALWAALGLRAVPAVVYVRARLRLDRGRAPSLAWPVLAHVLALLAIGALVYAYLLPVLTLLPFVALLARAVWYLSPWRPRVTVKAIGFTELGLGLFTVLMIAIGFWAGI